MTVHSDSLGLLKSIPGYEYDLIQTRFINGQRGRIPGSYPLSIQVDSRDIHLGVLEGYDGAGGCSDVPSTIPNP